MTLFFYISIILFQNTIEMSEKPLKENFISANFKMTLDGGDEGFYNSVKILHHKNNYYAFDSGNRVMIIYNENGDEVLRFGKEGNGPGEIAQFMHFETILNDYILLMQFNKFSLFNLNGEFVGEFKARSFDYSIEIKNDEVHLNPIPGKNISTFIYDLQGRLIKEIPLPESVEKTEQELFNLSDTKAMIKRFIQPTRWKKYGDYFIRNSVLEYRVDFANTNGEIIKSLTRDFERIKWVVPEDWEIVRVGDKAQTKALNESYKKDLMVAREGYDNDILKILGYFNNYLLVEVNSDDKTHFYIDVIDNKDQFITQIKIPKDTTSDKVQTLELTDNYIIAHFKTDDLGPYGKVYKLSIN